MRGFCGRIRFPEKSEQFLILRNVLIVSNVSFSYCFFFSFSVFHIFRWNHAIVQEIINIPDLAKMIYNLLLIQTLLKEGRDPWLYITCESLDCRLPAVLLSFSVFVIVVCTLLPWNKQNIHISLTIQAAMMYLFFPLHTSDWTHFTEEPGTAKSEALPVSRINSSSFCCVMSLAEQKKKKKKKGKRKNLHRFTLSMLLSSHWKRSVMLRKVLHYCQGFKTHY